MPEITVKFNPQFIHEEHLNAIYRVLALPVAQAADPTFTAEEHIDYYPEVNHPSAIASHLAITVKTIGFEDRKARMTLDVVQQWKESVLASIPSLFGLVPKDKPLIWVEFIDPAGPHV